MPEEPFPNVARIQEDNNSPQIDDKTCGDHIRGTAEDKQLFSECF